MYQLGRHTIAGPIDVQVFSRPNVVVRIGSYCSISDARIIIDGNHPVHELTTYPWHELFPDYPPNNWGKETPEIGNDVWIGSRVTIHSGAMIGDGAVIASDSVITKSVPPYAVVAGNPARVVKYRFDPKTIQTLLETRWWDLPEDVIGRELLPFHGDIHKAVERLKQIRAAEKAAT
jgi:acetyltransferase-like isoleucine patch superfamily enzyme